MSHAPKQRALEAFAEKQLSPTARKRMEAHLSRCSTCREGLTAIETYALLREEEAAEVPPEPSWERFEQALDSSLTRPRARFDRPAKGQQGGRSGRIVALAWPLLSVAATVAIIWLGVSGSRDAANQRPAKQAQTELPSLAVTGRVTLVAGAAQLERGDHSAPVSLQSEIREGSLLVTDHHTELHVALGPSTGFVLGPDSRLRVIELRAGRTRLELVVGTVGSRVRKLSATEQYRVLSGDVAASVRGTRFTVEQAQGTRVFVHEGLVEVARGTNTVALLSAGQGYSSLARPRAGFDESPKQAVEASHDVTVHEVGHAFGELRALHLPPVPELRNWRIDGASLSAQGGLSMRMPPGPALLSFEDMRGQVRSVTVDVSEDETHIDPLWLAKLVAPKEAPRAGHLEPEQISKVIKAGLDPLRRCYERSLRTSPALEAKLTLAIRVGADGRVQRAQAKAGAELPRELERCITSEAERLLFPKPEGGGSIAFEVPLNLKSK